MLFLLGDIMKKKRENIIHLCFRYYTCKLCPRQEKCEKEIKKDRKNVIQEKGAKKDAKNL